MLGVGSTVIRSGNLGWYVMRKGDDDCIKKSYSLMQKVNWKLLIMQIIDKPTVYSWTGSFIWFRCV